MTPSGRYDTLCLPEDQCESDSDDTVLKNLMGIKTRDDMEVAGKCHRLIKGDFGL